MSTGKETTVLFDPTVVNGMNNDLFLGERFGLLDTVNDPHPRLWEYYSSLKSLDWDANDFNFTPLNAEFKMKKKSIVQGMIQNLGWQWEADSLASNSLMSVMGHFVTDSSLKAVWDLIVANENLHGKTYSEIVRFSFDDPKQVLAEVLSVKQSLKRMESIEKVMVEAYNVGLRYSLGELSRDDPRVYRAAFLYVVALLCLERGPFMSSFAVTAANSIMGNFTPACDAVQRIAQDEVEVHINVDAYVIHHELSTKRGMQCMMDNYDIIKNMVDETFAGDIRWINYQSDTGSEIPGVGFDELKEYSRFSIGYLYDTLRIKPDFRIPTKNPLPYMEKWLNVARSQKSPMNQDTGQYRVSLVHRDDKGLVIPFA